MSNQSVLSLPSEWDHDHFSMDEESSAASSAEASKVFEQWQTEGDDADMMDVDIDVGTKLPNEEIAFVDFCPSPTSPMDELNYMNGEDMDKFSLDFLDTVETPTLVVTEEEVSKGSFEDRYNATLQKLAESMKRSQETRKSLVMKTTQTEHYSRSTFVSGVVESIETSSRQLQSYIQVARAG